MNSHTQFRPDRFSRFDDYWIQTDIERSKVNIEMELRALKLCITFLSIRIQKEDASMSECKPLIF